jgi:hypothetical protein
LAQLKARGKAIINPEAAKEDLKNATIELLRLSKSSSWNVHKEGNALVQNELNYGLMVLSMEKHTTKDIHKLSVMQFYQLKAFITLKNKANARG